MCMGGATSTDKEHRKEFISWWKEEEPNYEEWERAFSNINYADIIISHDGPYSVVKELSDKIEENPVNKMFDLLLEKIVKDKLNIKRWYLGHHHIDKIIKKDNINFNVLYNKVVEIRGPI